MTFKPQRKFTADEGMPSVDSTFSGPDTLEGDIDQINKMFDPASVHIGGSAGGIGTGNLQEGAATDTIVGERTLMDNVAPTSETGLIATLLGSLAYMVKAITGQSSWRTAPDKNLAQVYAKTETYSQAEVDGIAAGLVLGELSPHSVIPSMLRQDLFNMDNWAYALGGYKLTEFDLPAAGNIRETIVVSALTVATKITEFDLPAAGNIRETVTYSGHTYRKVTEFDVPSASNIKETITEV